MFTANLLAIANSGLLAGQDISVLDALLIAVVGMVVVLAVLAVIALFILLISKIMGAVEKAAEKKAPAASPKPAAAPQAPKGFPLPDTQSQGKLQLENVDEPTAAVIMAIVSNQSGIPLNRLAFKSIKLLEDK